MKVPVCVFTGLLAGLCLMTGCGGGNISMSLGKPVNGKIAYTSNEVSSSGVFVSPVLDIWVMDPDGSNQQNLTNGNATSIHPTWSPDGKKIAYESDGIWIMNADGTGQHRIITAGITPTWSHDGAKIAFVLDGEIEVMKTDGTDRQNITNEHLPINCFNPAWSPDDSKITFTTRDRSLWVMLADGSNRNRIASDANEPAWSPDGQRIAFSHQGIDIWTVNADGSNPVNLTNDIIDNSAINATESPSWSPDGTLITFQKRTFLSDPSTGSRSSIWTMNTDGSDRKSLNLLPTANTTDPAWGAAR